MRSVLGTRNVETVRLRPSRAALLAVLFLLFCVTPLAFVATPLLVLYAIPLGVLLWIFRSGTDVDAEGLTVRAVAGHRRIAWSQIQALSPASGGELYAVLRDGRSLRLPQVRLRHLELVAAASGGHVPSLQQAGTAGGGDDESSQRSTTQATTQTPSTQHNKGAARE